jgi:nucleotide-binding universal stress UspA family protein
VVRLDVTDAAPAGAIVEQAGAWGADLIVLGAEPARGLARRLLGATHERVVARAPCAVLVVTPPEPGPARARGRVAAGGHGPVAAKGGA